MPVAMTATSHERMNRTRGLSRSAGVMREVYGIDLSFRVRARNDESERSACNKVSPFPLPSVHRPRIIVDADPYCLIVRTAPPFHREEMTWLPVPYHHSTRSIPPRHGSRGSRPRLTRGTSSGPP